MNKQLQLSSKVNIVIPVYNALDQLKVCVESIRRNTDFHQIQVIFVDDRSTDQNVIPYLKDIVSQSEFHGILLENDVNQGFSASVNRGISEGGDAEDVIILNSDTIVTKNWVEKLQQAAYSDPAIATVTPLSNNATIYSIPNFCEPNEIPQGLSLDAYAEIVERASMHLYPQTPVSHGFCMYVRRNALRAVGLFDSKAFGRGYGEENDFCFRAEQLGFRHIMCDDTYIYHNETASFQTEEKKKLIRDHEKILLERYPEQMKKNAEYIRSNPHQYIRDNIRMYQKLTTDNRTRKQRKNILYILHSDFREDAANNIGGTQFHVKDLMQGLRHEYGIYIASRDGAYMRLTAYTAKERLSFKFYIGDQNHYYSFHDQKLRKLFDEVLQYFGIDLVHVHHPGSLSFDIFDAANECKIPIVTTLHDFYYICPNVKLLEKGKRYCGGSCEDCRACITDQFGISPYSDYKAYWQRQCLKALDMSDMLITPSHSAKQLYETLIPALKKRREPVRVVPHGMDKNKSISENVSLNILSENDNDHSEVVLHEKKIAFIGWLNEAKGSQLACSIIEAAGNKYQWYVIGGIADADLFALDRKNLIKLNRYSREEASDILQANQIDLVCILPIWPETFCYTLSEALLAGIPVLTTDIGAMGERMRNQPYGWTVPYQSGSERILQKIDEIFSNPEAYQNVKDSLAHYRHRSTADMDAEYDTIYKELLKNNELKQKEILEITSQANISEPDKSDSSEINRLMYTAFASCPDSGAQTLLDDADLEERMDELEKKLKSIQGSVEYKVIKQLSGMKIPLKKQMTGILRLGYKAYRNLTK